MSDLDPDLQAILDAETPEERDRAIIAAHQESRRRMKRWGWITLRAIGAIGVILGVAILVGQLQNNDRADENQANLQQQATERSANSLRACIKDDRDNSNFSAFLRDLFPESSKLTEEQRAARQVFLDKAKRRYPYHAEKPKTDREISRQTFCERQVKATVKTER